MNPVPQYKVTVSYEGGALLIQNAISLEAAISILACIVEDEEGEVVRNFSVRKIVAKAQVPVTIAHVDAVPVAGGEEPTQKRACPSPPEP